jgi:hypothetical protein
MSLGWTRNSKNKKRQIISSSQLRKITIRERIKIYLVRGLPNISLQLQDSHFLMR